MAGRVGVLHVRAALSGFGKWLIGVVGEGRVIAPDRPQRVGDALVVECLDRHVVNRRGMLHELAGDFDESFRLEIRLLEREVVGEQIADCLDRAGRGGLA